MKTLNVGFQASAWVDHDAQRVRSRHMAGGELRIVGGHGTRANDDGVAQRAHAMDVDQVVVPGHELRIT